jgi:hypothetical protein
MQILPDSSHIKPCVAPTLLINIPESSKGEPDCVAANIGFDY